MVKKFDFTIDATPIPGRNDYSVTVIDHSDGTDAYFTVSSAEDAAHVALVWLGLESNVAH